MFGYDEDVPLLTAFPLIQRLILSSYSRKLFSHTKSQIIILLALSTNNTLTMSQIAQYITSSNEQATRAVAPLVDEGLVFRCVDEQNRTHVLVQLTEKGREFINVRKEELRRDLNKRLDSTLSDDERNELNSAVKTIIRLVEKIE